MSRLRFHRDVGAGRDVDRDIGVVVPDTLWTPSVAAALGTPLGRRVMHINERLVEGVTILDLNGTLTLGGGDAVLTDKIHSLVHEGRRDFLLNLNNVPHVDSTGISEMIGAYTTTKRVGGRLKLLNLTKRIRDLLVITKLLTVFETFDTEAEAVHSFSTPEV